MIGCCEGRVGGEWVGRAWLGPDSAGLVVGRENGAEGAVLGCVVVGLDDLGEKFGLVGEGAG